MKKFTAVILILVMAIEVKAQGMTGEVVPQSQSVLDSYFASNSIPGQLQYWEWIDTMFWEVNAEYTNAQAAQQSAMAAVAVNSRVIGSIYLAVGLSSSVHQTWTYYATNNFSSNTVAVGTLNPHGTLCYYVWLTNYFAMPVSSLAATPFSGPVSFTCTMPPMFGGVLTNAVGVPAPVVTSGFGGANVTLAPFLTSDSTNTYVLTTNFFAFYANLGGASGANEKTNVYLFTFYQ